MVDLLLPQWKRTPLALTTSDFRHSLASASSPVTSASRWAVPLDPIDGADATFATDNFKAGELIGRATSHQIVDGSSKPFVSMHSMM